jgi:hypothetical protein
MFKLATSSFPVRTGTMNRLFSLTLTIAAIVVLQATADDKDSKSKPTGVLTVLGTVQGEITQLSDGGSKIEVKYKDVVEVADRSRRIQGASSSSKFRLPRTTLKERNQELDLRVFPATPIRLLNMPGESKADRAKKEKEARDAAMKDDDDTDDKKSKDKKVEKSKKERTLPGKAAEMKDLRKGQVIVVSVAREDLPGFNRLVATSIYILGEK